MIPDGFRDLGLVLRYLIFQCPAASGILIASSYRPALVVKGDPVAGLVALSYHHGQSRMPCNLCQP